MEKKIKIGLAFLVVCTVLVSLTVLYNYFNQGMEPPDTIHVDVLVDLKSPNDGTIYVTCPENEVSKDDFDVFAGANSKACEILDQYYIPWEEDPFSVKPLREDGNVTVSLDFFAENKSEFVGPVCTFNSTFLSFYQVADFTVILPEGYEIVDIATENAVKKPKRRFVDDRWEIETKTLENSEFQIRITYNQVEIENRDLSICDKTWQGVQYQKTKDWCYTDVAVDKKDISICEKIQNQDNKEGCYSGVAEAKQDISICEKIHDQDCKDECYVSVAKAKQDISICEKMEQNPYKAYKELCYSKVAFAKQDPTICVQIQYQNIRDDCYFSVAAIKENISICDKIQRNFNKESCYLEVASRKQDISICDKIHDQGIKDLCFVDLIETLTVNK